MPMLDLLAFGLLGASALAATLCLLLLRARHGGRWIWFGVSLAAFLLLTRLMLERLLPALVDAPASFRVLLHQGFEALAALALAFACDAAIRRYLWYGRLGENGRSHVPAILIGLASLAGYALTLLLIASQILGLDVTAVAATSGVVAIVLGVSAQQTLARSSLASRSTSRARSGWVTACRSTACGAWWWTPTGGR